MNDAQKRIIRALRDGIPVSRSPYEDVASRVGISVDDLLDQLRRWKQDGTIRRFGAVLRHYKAGYTTNAMVAWDVPEDLTEDFAAIAASFRNVSHCYQRPRFPGFNYNVYTMIHGISKAECEATISDIQMMSSVSNRLVLYTTKEYKKTSPVFFTELSQR